MKLEPRQRSDTRKLKFNVSVVFGHIKPGVSTRHLGFKKDRIHRAISNS